MRAGSTSSSSTRAAAKGARVFGTPRGHDELVSFVAYFGARVTNAVAACKVEDVVLRAVVASRHDPALARMLPAFLWRVRDAIDVDSLAARAVRRRCAPVLGYYLDVSARLGSVARFRRAAWGLRRYAHAKRPCYLFLKTAANPFEATAARERSSEVALRWGWFTSTPLDSFETYFHKVASL